MHYSSALLQGVASAAEFGGPPRALEGSVRGLG